MEYFVILTLALPRPGGMEQITHTMTVTARPGATRAGLLDHVKKGLGERWQGANVLFFSAELNTLGGA